MGKKNKTDTPQISVKIDAEVDRVWRELFGSQDERGAETMPIKQATESAFLLFASYPEEARYWLANRLANAQFREKLSRLLLVEWQKMKDALSSQA